ncbi:MAG TPA: hypothetical protein PKA64_12370 [Myxococcota bacterium]|nr:hypothetical protein [Myxococcota bacterium]
MRALWLAVALTACSGSAGDGDVDLGPRGDCNPVDPALCALPFPSSFHTIEDAEAATGLRADFGPTTLPENRDHVPLRPDAWNRRDGFSINSVAMTHAPGVDVSALVSHLDIDAAMAPDARTAIVDATTGARHPHWAELDVTSPDPTPGDDHRLLLLRPAIPYEWDHTYVVGLRGLVDATGAPIEPSPAFRALRDGVPSDDPDVERQRARYDEVVFPALERAGFARAELVQAWDFHTASRADTLAPIEHMRDDALAWAEREGFTWAFDKVEDRDCAQPGEHIARHLEGHFTAPYYTTKDGPGAFLARGADGMPEVQGETRVDFIVRVPCSVAHGADGEGARARSAPIVQYGHGLLGDKDEVNSGYLADMADRFGWVLYASDWTGFADEDAGGIALMIAIDPSDFAFIPERSHQGMIEFALGMRLMAGPMIDDPNLQFDGQAVLDPERRFYYGNSQGAILGTAYLGLSTDIARGGLGVGGGPYSLLLARSRDFETFFRVFKEKYLDHREITLFVNGLTQQIWDPVEPGGWMWDMARDALTPKQVLMQVAIGDNQVTTLGAEFEARAFGATLVDPPAREVWGLDVAQAPFTGSALVEWSYEDGPAEPVIGLPPGDPDPHECPRRERAAQDQLRAFLETGVVEQTCDGVCSGRVAVTCP